MAHLVKGALSLALVAALGCASARYPAPSAPTEPVIDSSCGLTQSRPSKSPRDIPEGYSVQFIDAVMEKLLVREAKVSEYGIEMGTAQFNLQSGNIALAWYESLAPVNSTLGDPDLDQSYQVSRELMEALQPGANVRLALFERALRDSFPFETCGELEQTLAGKPIVFSAIDHDADGRYLSGILSAKRELRE